MKKKTILIGAIAILAIAAIVFYLLPRKEADVMHILTAQAQTGRIAKSITSTGTVQPEDTVSVGAQVSGVIQAVYVDFNSVVRQGQLLAKVDPSIISAQIEQVKASLANALSNLEYQQLTFDRQRKLFDLGAISKADFQLSTNQFNMARAAVDNSRAQLKLAEKNLYYTNIFSPINGTVLNRNVSAGQTIASSFNAPTLFVIAKDLTKMQIRAAVDEADIGGVRSGQRATFTVDAFPDDLFKGRVKEVQLHPTVSSNVVTYATLINVDNQEMKLKPGMTANINIFTREDSGLLVIPLRALQFKPDSATMKGHIIRRLATAGAERQQAGKASPRQNNVVWLVSGDTLTETPVIVGLKDDMNVEVEQGLSPGDEVVIGRVANNGTAAGKAGQKSPFMPQMPRRQAGSPRTP
jgi:HlyD family secretion protein